MLNIVIPMAGRGSRFAEAGYTIPKPLIPIHGVPMIKVVMDNLAPQMPHRFILICLNHHIEQYNLVHTLKSFAENVEIIGINGVTEGQLCTVLEASRFFDNNDPVITANSDQYIDFSIDKFIGNLLEGGLDGLIMTMRSSDPKWSYVQVNENNLVSKTAEKIVISNMATVGIYGFSRGQDLVRYGKETIRMNERTNNEFYICPSYNAMINDGAKVGIYSVGEEYNGMFGLGIPQDLNFFINHPISSRISPK